MISVYFPLWSRDRSMGFAFQTGEGCGIRDARWADPWSWVLVELPEVLRGEGLVGMGHCPVEGWAFGGARPARFGHRRRGALKPGCARCSLVGDREHPARTQVSIAVRLKGGTPVDSECAWRARRELGSIVGGRASLRGRADPGKFRRPAPPSTSTSSQPAGSAPPL